MDSKQIEINELNERLRNVIVGTCNTIGCNDCGLKWEGGCSATELQGKVDELEYGKPNESKS